MLLKNYLTEEEWLEPIIKKDPDSTTEEDWRFSFTPSKQTRLEKSNFMLSGYIKGDDRLNATKQVNFLCQNKYMVAPIGTRPSWNGNCIHMSNNIFNIYLNSLELRGNDIYSDDILIFENTKVLLVEMVGAGGGGTGGWLLNNGSGGGAGGYACFLLDFTLHPKYNFYTGYGGNGVKGKQGSQAANGADSYVIAEDTGEEICRCYGGNGAHGDKGATGGGAKLGAGVIGFTKSGYSGAVEEQASYMDETRITGITYGEEDMIYPATQVPAGGNNHGGAGGCSVLSKGGACGGRKQDGAKGPGSGAGGGGGGVGGSSGGKGASGLIRFYY